MFSKWFRVESSDGSVLEGRKVWRRSLELVAEFDGEQVLVNVDVENVERLRDWLIRVYPPRIYAAGGSDKT